MSSTALCDGPQQPKWPRRKTIHPTAQAGWYACARYRENRRYGTSSIKQDEEGGTRSLLALPFKLHVKLRSSASHSSVLPMVVQPVWQRPSGERAGHITPTSSSARSAAHYLGASCCQHVLKPCSACQKKTGLIYLTFQRIREKKNRLKKERLNLGTLFLGELVMDLTLSLSVSPPGLSIHNFPMSMLL